MKQKWQEGRNYRRFKNETGEVVRRVITVDEQDVEVSEEVFLAYSQAERRERYIAEEVEPGLVLSLDKLIEDGVPLQKMGVEPIESAEDSVVELERKAERFQQLHKLPEALAELADSDRELIEALYFKGMSAREYARQQHVYHRAIIYRRDKILLKLQQLLCEKN